MKKLVSLLLAVMMLLSVSVPAFAAHELPSRTVKMAAPMPDGINAEETEWVFRTRGGICEMRLWSITYGIWLTDWIPIGTVIDP